MQSPKVAGVSSAACDQDFCYTDYPAIIKRAGLNGYPPPAAQDEPDNGPDKAEGGAPDHVRLLIGPVSAGDRARFEQLAAELEVDCAVVAAAEGVENGDGEGV